ncbi:hypothetical protein SK128_003020 [Halocaridina rubra]|uniref:NACHT domain-containing protein n=1 Tax=Halocaridina rubra TaxID=373956 RepID=A0AAN8WI55_HALRR
MSIHSSPGGINDKDQYNFKVYKVLVNEARDVLHYILLQCCKDKDHSISFETYAKDKLGISCTEFKKKFNKTMRDKMKADFSGGKFDVSLLWACITHLCKSVNSDDKKIYIDPIKDFRNKFIHNLIDISSEYEMNTQLQHLGGLLQKSLLKFKEILCIPSTSLEKKIEDVEKRIEEIKHSSVSVPDITNYKAQIKKLREAKKTHVRDNGIPHLKEIYQELSNVDPVSWLIGKDRLDVKMVYTRLNIVANKTGRHHDTHTRTDDDESLYSVGHEQLLELKTEDGNHPLVTLVKGEAGSGKSTLARYILKDYADLNTKSPSSSIRGLEEYELVLYIECRNKSISNFVELLKSSMPGVPCEMSDDDFVSSVLDMKTLIVVDGLDEMRDDSGSDKLLKELFDKYVPMSNGKQRFIMTTRPQVKSLHPYSKYPCIHARILGIPPEQRENFVERLHDLMLKEGISKQSTSDLIDYVKQSQSRLGDHYRLPLNLTLLTYLWAEDPENVNSVTTSTRLYDALLELLKLRLKSRIKDVVGSTDKHVVGSTDKLEDKIEEYLKTVLMVYLQTHLSRDIHLSKGSIEKLEEVCKKVVLPFDEMVGPFFRLDTEMSAYGTQVLLKAPHNSIMEFFSAYHICNCMITHDVQAGLSQEVEKLRKKFHEHGMNTKPFQELDSECKNKRKSFEDILKNALTNGGALGEIDFAVHHNVLLHLGGLLALKDKAYLHENSRYLVDFLQEGGITEAQWLDLTAEAECDPKLTEIVAEQICKRLVIRDGHILAALEIFNYLDTKLPILVILECEVKSIPDIEAFMKKLSERDCDVELLLKNHWKNPSLGNSTNHLQKLHGKQCTVSRFTGNLDDLDALPEGLENLRLAVSSDDQARKICESLEALELDYLGLHVTKEVSHSSLKPLPVLKPMERMTGTLWISRVANDDINKACDIAAALLPEGMKFNSIALPRCKLTGKGLKTLILRLKEMNIQVSAKDGVKTDSENIDNSEVTPLRIFCKDTLNCELHWGDEASVW